ncbi:hypothetical protein ACFQ4K_18820 [Tistrella bauzanensis]
MIDSDVIAAGKAPGSATSARNAAIPASDAPCPVSSLAADWAILDDQIMATWAADAPDADLSLALDVLRNAVVAQALARTPRSAAGAAFQAYAVGLSIAIANDPDTPPPTEAATSPKRPMARAT